MSFKYFGMEEKVEHARVVALFRLIELTYVPGNNLEKFGFVVTEKKKGAIRLPLLLYCGDCTCDGMITLITTNSLDRIIEFTLSSFS